MREVSLWVWLCFVRDLIRTDGWTDSSGESALQLLVRLMCLSWYQRGIIQADVGFCCGNAAKAEYKI
jgi:hypothetical protein